MLLAMPLPVPDFNLSFVLFYNPSLGKNKYANNFQVFLFGQQLPPRYVLVYLHMHKLYCRFLFVFFSLLCFG